MSFQVWAWLGLLAYTLHIMEEFAFDWRNWARDVIRLPVEWSDFYVTNAAVVILGFAQAQISYALPVAALTFAALMLINATFFHVVPMMATRGRFSPGTFTAVLLFYPVALGIYRSAAAEGQVSTVTVIGSVVGGALLMAYPVAMMRLRGLPYFRQTPEGSVGVDQASTSSSVG
ncbi:HXXEE domain-containing protein [Ancylobacter mangrovi]|uniref:HXXEE domain-containing protein n=1 Tax=Ancylobacter mangrovi TaxID=2972472 RepID=A0A9X2PEZ8_9HYPH|nr:HXXEE domain-containing protein [Ancylobacter mangrovi]MCS0496174.1 HXXEE domain-containing protein [Ancylobacter mangrovi]MCS0504172.1 HXXEE domain-containing protein [Ancylobacter mangrovi]